MNLQSAIKETQESIHRINNAMEKALKGGASSDSRGYRFLQRLRINHSNMLQDMERRLAEDKE